MIHGRDSVSGAELRVLDVIRKNRKSRKCTIPALETRKFETLNWTSRPVGSVQFKVSNFRVSNAGIVHFRDFRFFARLALDNGNSPQLHPVFIGTVTPSWYVPMRGAPGARGGTAKPEF